MSETPRGDAALAALVARWSGTPLCISPRYLRGLLSCAPVGAAPDGPWDRETGGLPGWRVAGADGRVAVLPVHGPLVYRHDLIAGLFGFSSYEDLQALAEDAFTSPDVDAVVLDLDTPGGEVAGLFETAEAIRRMADEAGKPLAAVANPAALSAGYALAAVADRVFALPSAELGSIGVVAVHLDMSGADRQAGLNFEFVYAGERKIDGNPHMPLSERARADLQRDVDALYARFVDHVARYRRLAPEAVRATEAGTYLGRDAVAAGLADAVGTPDAVAAALSSPEPRRISVMTEPVTPTARDAGAEPAAGPAPEPVREPAPDAHVPEKLEAELREQAAELLQVATLAARLGVQVDAAVALRRGIGADALRRQVLETLAARADAERIQAVVPPEPRGASAYSEAVARALERISRR